MTTNTNIANNRIVTGVKLQSGVVDGELMVWTDVEPSHSYIYDRGVGLMRKGSTAFSLLINHITREVGQTYYRIVFWKESSSNASTTSIIVINGTDLIIKQID